MYEYYFAFMYDTAEIKRSYTAACYTMDYKLDSCENMIKFMEYLKQEGYENPIILFFKQLNE